MGSFGITVVLSACCRPTADTLASDVALVFGKFDNVSVILFFIFACNSSASSISFQYLPPDINLISVRRIHEVFFASVLETALQLINGFYAFRLLLDFAVTHLKVPFLHLISE